METKRCSKCGEVKALGAFAVRRGQCLVCRAEWARGHRVKNAEAIAAKKREYWEKNKAAYVARGQRYRDRAKDALTDSHVRSRLYATTGLLAHQIPDELVRMKRAMLATKRKVRAINNHVKEQNRE